MTLDRRRRIQDRLAVRGNRRAFAVQEPRTLRDRLRIVARACSVLARAHAAGVVHGDVRPTNVVVDELGDSDVIGWETASLIDDNDEERTGITRTPYSAPELGTRRLDTRADVYSLGVILHEVLALEPFAAPELELTCALALVQDREQRLASAHELGNAITCFLDG